MSLLLPLFKTEFQIASIQGIGYRVIQCIAHAIALGTIEQPHAIGHLHDQIHGVGHKPRVVFKLEDQAVFYRAVDQTAIAATLAEVMGVRAERAEGDVLAEVVS